MTPNKIVAGVSDLFFAAKISATAKQVNATVEFLSSAEPILARAADGADLVILDLGQNALDPVSLISRLKTGPASAEVFVVAFANHERTDLMESAKEAGCDQVLTRGTFSQMLPDLLRRPE